MSKLHIANTYFEWELEQKDRVPLEKALQKNQIFLQLQFLPILYAEPGDGVAVTDLPDVDLGIPLYRLSEQILNYKRVESWGASRAVAQWAEERGLTYEMPSWEVVKQVNSKVFSFANSPKLPGAILLHNQEEAKEWFASSPCQKVFKTCFGVSGKGHLWSPDAIKEWPVIGDPWVKRVLDFSTQWTIGKEISYLGATLCVNDAQGKYLSNSAGPPALLFGSHLHHLEAHRKVVLPILHKMAELGYFGNVGVDAMIYGDGHLHPVVEINARKTMGFVTLQLQKKRFPEQVITLYFQDKKIEEATPLLPSKLGRIHFRKQLYLTRQLQNSIAR